MIVKEFFAGKDIITRDMISSYSQVVIDNLQKIDNFNTCKFCQKTKYQSIPNFLKTYAIKTTPNKTCYI